MNKGGDVIKLGDRLWAETERLQQQLPLGIDIHVVADQREDVLSVPRGPFVSGGAIQPVFVLDDGRLIRRQVRIGLAGYERLEITDGLTEGQTIVLSDMRDFAHLEMVRLTGRASPDPKGAGR